MIIVEMPEGWSLVPVEVVKVGTKLIADGGFTCLCEGEIVISARFSPTSAAPAMR